MIKFLLSALLTKQTATDYNCVDESAWLDWHAIATWYLRNDKNEAQIMKSHDLVRIAWRNNNIFTRYFWTLLAATDKHNQYQYSQSKGLPGLKLLETWSWGQPSLRLKGKCFAHSSR